MLDLYIQNEDEFDFIPSEEIISNWIQAALLKPYNQLEQLIRIVSESEIQQLNAEYLNKNKPTNILSFPTEQHDFLDYECLGDLVICADVVKLESNQQHKALNDHWAHLIVHGMLHLQGYDHIKDDEAELMEQLEVKILETLSIPNPYNGLR